MSFASRFGKIAIENEVTQPEVVDAIPEDDNIYVDHADNAAVVEQGLAEIDSATTDVETLDALATKAEEIQERDGGLNQPTAEILDIAVEAIYQRLNIRKKPMLAMEAFGNKASAGKATSIAIENWKETVKAFGKKIKDAFLKLIEYIKNFFSSFRKKSEKVKEEMKTALLKYEEVAKQPEMQPKEPLKAEADAKVPGYFKNLYYGEETINGEGLIKNYQKTLDIIEELLGSLGTMPTNSAAKQIMEKMDQYETIDEILPEVKMEKVPDIGGATKTAKSDKPGLTAFIYEMPVSQNVYTIELPSPNDEANQTGLMLKHAAGSSFRAEVSSDQKIKNIEWLSLKDAGQLSEMFLSANDKAIKPLNERLAEMDALLKQIDEIMKELETSEGERNTKKDVMMRDFLRLSFNGGIRMVTASNALMTTLTALLDKTASSIVSYVNDSVPHFATNS